MDAIVDLLVNKVAEIVEENATLILGIKDEVEELLSELRSFKAYLNEAARNGGGNENAVLGDAVQKIQSVVNEAEDAIDKYVVEGRKHRAKGILMRSLEKVGYYKKVSEAAREIQGIKEKAQRIRQHHAHSLELIQDGGAYNPRPVHQAPVVEEDNVVGFDEEAQVIKDRLTKGSEDLVVISIVGMAGLGKTTLTKMVFNDCELHFEFFTRLWIYVSRTMNRRQIFMDIISRFTKEMEGYESMSEELLAERIKEFLKGGRYFIVVDDVWCKKDWDLLKIAFPNNQKGSRVLVTTRDLEVARHVDSSLSPHKLKFLEHEESWALLQNKAFYKESCPQFLEPIGRSIARKCNGLPLAVVVIAGVLHNEITFATWKTVDEDPFPVINQQGQSYNELIKLSYNQLLNQHAKDCFLYLAAFPIGHEVSAWKLIRLWIAEGFIPPSPNLEGTAERYLKDMVDKNLLMVIKRRADGGIETCRLHDTLHEFCKSEASNKNLFHEIDGERIERNEDYRRLCLHSSLKSFIDSESKPSGEHIRSFLTSTKLEIPKEHLATIPKSYPLLKVFDVESLRFEILPKELYELYHLRYLAISTDLKLLPKPFTDLWNLQTLVLNTSQSTIDVKAEIWNMPKLRHILANASLEFPPPPKNCNEMSSCANLQTLSTISPNSCTEDIVTKTPNLLKLGVRGNLLELLERKGGICLFDNIQKLCSLENLKLVHEATNDYHTSILRGFPRADKFPRKLRKLTLSNTSFVWKDICILGSLDELEVLKLEDSAAKGEYWEVNEVVFKNLEFLRIGRTDLVQWSIEKSSFPVIKQLHLSHCESLNDVPLAFKDVESLKVMELFCTNKNAATSARKIRELNDGFELSIYPPDH